MSRVGQVWYARRRSFGDVFELHVIVRGRTFADKTVAWYLRPLERIANDREEIGHFETQFLWIEGGGTDVWVNSRFT